MQREEVGGGEHLVRGLGAIHAELPEALRRHERVEGDDAHLEPERAPGDLLADPPEAEDAEPLARELQPP